jgi:Polyketide cyclase / dehydrase and lipid transport
LGRTDGTFTALDVEPGSRVEYRADFAGLQPRITYTVEPAGEGTRFTRAVEMRPSGFKMLMTPMMAFLLPRRNKVFVQNLKRALES